MGGVQRPTLLQVLLPNEDRVCWEPTGTGAGTGRLGAASPGRSPPQLLGAGLLLRLLPSLCSGWEGSRGASGTAPQRPRGTGRPGVALSAPPWLPPPKAKPPAPLESTGPSNAPNVSHSSLGSLPGNWKDRTKREVPRRLCTSTSGDLGSIPGWGAQAFERRDPCEVSPAFTSALSLRALSKLQGRTTEPKRAEALLGGEQRSDLGVAEEPRA